MAATKRFGRQLGTWWEPDLISGAGRARPEWAVIKCGGMVHGLKLNYIWLNNNIFI